MALNVFELFGKIAIDSSGAKSGLDSAVGHAQKAESKLAATFKKIGAAVAAAFTVKAVVDFGKQCTQAYATIAAEESAFAQIMGDYAGTAQQKLDAVASKTGVVSTRLTSSMTSLTAKFKGLGYSVADATTLAADGLMIASDAAAFWDMSLDESMSHLNSFINGSYEGGEAIGLFANDTQMALYAVEEGIVADTKAWAKLDEATKQATRLQYAMNMQKMSGATGQAAKESQQYANVMANLKEHWRQFQGIIGQPILEKLVLPAMQKLNEFMPKLNTAVQNGIAWLDTGFNKIKSYFTDVFTEGGINFSALPAALGRMFGDLVGQIPGWLASVGSTISNTWTNTVWPAVQGAFKATLGIELPDWATVKQSISDGWNNTVWPAVQDFFTKAFGITLPSWEQLKTKISDGWNKTVWPAIQGFFKSPMEVILPAWETLKTDITNGWQNTVWPFVKDFFTKPFEVSLPSWDEIKTSISDGWNNTIWPAIQGFFSKNFDIILPSWEDLKANIVNSWNTYVVPEISGLFESVFEVKLEDADGTEIGKKIREWWDKAVAFIGDIFKDVFILETEDSDGSTAGQRIKEWRDKVFAFVGNIFRGFFGIDPEDTESTGNRIITWFEEVLKFIGDIFYDTFVLIFGSEETTAGDLKTWWNNILASIGNLFSKTFELLLPGVAEMISKIQSWWNSVKSGLGLSTTATVDVVTRRTELVTKINNSPGVGSSSGASSSSPVANTGGQGIGQSAFLYYFNSHATGLDYVPYDNYLARLHKGEAVLTSSEADVWRGGGTGRVEAALTQMSEILRTIAQNTGADKQVVLDTGAVVGQLAPGIDAQLGMYMNRKGRRN